jgi:hypothetical protein
LDPPQTERKHIVLLGRFFKGRQSKVGLASSALVLWGVVVDCCGVEWGGGVMRVWRLLCSSPLCKNRPGLPALQGHGAAVELFRKLQPRLPAGTQLHLIGNLMVGHKDYLMAVREVGAAWVICSD